MILYTLAMNPFLMMVEREIMSITILQQKTCAAACADDVSIYLENQQNIQNLEELIRICEEATGAEKYFLKSKALLHGSWVTNKNIMNTSCVNEIKIL
jgi:hypothetical protein